VTTDAASRAAAVLPTTPGVYRFRDDRGRAIYVGRAADLRHRVASYGGGLSDRPHLRRMVAQIARVEALPCDSAHEAAWLERNILVTAKPRWNRVRGGLEVPSYITLTRTTTTARLAVAHTPVASGGVLTFGPYLGGTRTRLAVDGLDRVLGLAYAGDRLGGFDRDMARVRGVRAEDRSVRAELAADSLTRDPTALAVVTELLVAQRDAAAAALAFEAAARVQAEIEALVWVTAEQKVTVDDGPDVVVAGWHDGVLVRLEIRGGRMNHWHQREVSARAAAATLSATPPRWVGFADRAARQAVALRDAAGR